MECGFWNHVIKYIVAPALLSWKSLTLGNASYAMKTLNQT